MNPVNEKQVVKVIERIANALEDINAALHFGDADNRIFPIAEGLDDVRANIKSISAQMP